jgi:hypothetical protein
MGGVRMPERVKIIGEIQTDTTHLLPLSSQPANMGVWIDGTAAGRFDGVDGLESGLTTSICVLLEKFNNYSTSHTHNTFHNPHPDNPADM